MSSSGPALRFPPLPPAVSPSPLQLSPGLLRPVSCLCPAVLPAQTLHTARVHRAERPEAPPACSWPCPRCYSPPIRLLGPQRLSRGVSIPSAPPPHRAIGWPGPPPRASVGAQIVACRVTAGWREPSPGVCGAAQCLLVASGDGLARKPDTQVASPEHPAIRTQRHTLPTR